MRWSGRDVKSHVESRAGSLPGAAHRDGEPSSVEVADERRPIGREAHAGELSAAVRVASDVSDPSVGVDGANELLTAAVLRHEHLAPGRDGDVVGAVELMAPRGLRHELEHV